MPQAPKLSFTLFITLHVEFSSEQDLTCDFVFPDEEGEDEGEDVKAITGDGIEEKKVGTKRSIGYESYICSEK